MTRYALMLAMFAFAATVSADTGTHEKTEEVAAEEVATEAEGEKTEAAAS